MGRVRTLTSAPESRYFYALARPIRINQPEVALALAAQQGAVRLRDARDAGVHPEVLRRLVDQGLMEKVGRGTYALASADVSAHRDLALASLRVPNGVVCLLSALSLHEIGTQLPHEVWMMIDRRSRKPSVDHPSIRFVRGSGAVLATGIQSVEIDGRRVRVFDPAKTVVDCFRYRRHVGLDVALEAMREALRARRCTPAQIWEHATRCGVGSVIRPYLEAAAEAMA